MEKLTQQVRILVQETVSVDGLDIDLEDDTSLIESGLLDSLRIVSLVQSLQSEFDLEFDFADITLENFESVNAIAACVAAQQA